MSDGSDGSSLDASASRRLGEGRPDVSAPTTTTPDGVEEDADDTPTVRSEWNRYRPDISTDGDASSKRKRSRSLSTPSLTSAGSSDDDSSRSMTGSPIPSRQRKRARHVSGDPPSEAGV
ncbi:hypothetical protein M231_01880 [Tremella mesenterica]|uniref:Uncharacterized protein n=1 Tax=Tremella mesenterica TaxID=5217 RepID=A0A4Q1BS48_TREME|nr:hypothetical protein M231_01880 [Tremella mesenterica]